MVRKTDFNQAPYFDDYDPGKGFVSILFSPSAVQARELNQMQTILQDQIEQLGSHLFTEGSMVIPGGVSMKLRHDFAQFQITSATDILNLVGRDDLFVRSRDTDVRAKIAIVVAATAPSTTHRAFVDYTTAGVDNTQSAFTPGEDGYIYTDVGGVETTVANINFSSIGLGSTVQVNEGVYFVRGSMVRNEAQHIVISESTPSASARVGFEVTEEIITATEDSSLYSNALGEDNFQAPGADRFRINLTLKQVGLEENIDDFVELVRIEENEIAKQVETTTYSLIQEAIAKRTYEQAGDYTVDRHEASVNNHDTDPTKITATVKPGVSYVQGYRVENQGPLKLDVDRARDTQVSNNSVTAAAFGRYINVSNVQGSANLDSETEVLILDAVDVILARARLVSAAPTTVEGASSSLRLHLTSFDASVMVDARKVRVETSGSVTTMTATIETGENILRDTNSPELIFNLPSVSVKTLAPPTGRDTTYTVMKSYLITLDNSGVAQLSAGPNSIFEPHSDDTYFVGRYDATGSKILGGIDTSGGVPAGSVLAVNLPAHANQQIVILAPVIKTDAQPRVKTLLEHTVDIDMNGANRVSFTHQDVFTLVSAIDQTSGDDIVDQFTLDTGVRDTVYAPGSVALRNNETSQSIVRFTYKYFTHGIGDYFCVDSYASISYDDIPSYTAVNGTVYDMRDAIDFRVRVDATGKMVDDRDIVRPNSVIRNDVEFYLPRTDAIYVDQKGNFGVTVGVSGLAALTPKVPDLSMRLYNLHVPAYTPSAKGVNVEYIDNRRYTMRDIGKLETRIENLEFYTTLSQLESSAEAIQVFDDAGLPRFKNGIAADPFVDWRLTDLSSREQSASIDPNNGGQLRPEMMMQSLGAQHSSDNAHHLAGVISQVNGPIPVAEAAQFSLPTVGTIVSRSQPYATRDINVNPYAVYTWQGFVSLKPTADVWKDIQYADPIIVNETDDQRGGLTEGTVWGSWVTTSSRLMWGSRIVFTDQTRTGVTTQFTSWTTESAVDNSIGTEVIPFMRSIDVSFAATNLKPHARIYAFFDGVEVSGECIQTGKSLGEPLITDASGSITGIFKIPNRDGLRFETGTSSFRLTDSPNDSRDADEFGTSTDTTFTSNGTLETRQVTVTRTRHLGFTQSVSSQNQTVRTRRDPLAQSFAISSDVGEMIHSVDVFFTTKSTDIPVTMEVRTVENGFPTTDVITRKTLHPSDVQISPIADIPTKFVFDEYLFLESEREYAIVILADTQDYNVGIAQMGEIVLGGTFVISKQPTIGVFFTSQNGSTWSPHQNQDMKFTIHRYDFETSGQLTLECTDPESRLIDANPFKITVGDVVAQLRIPNHGLQVGHTFTISGAIASGGLTSGDINRVFTVNNVIDFDTVEVNLGGTPTVTGVTGGPRVEYTGNVMLNALHANFDTFVVDRTNVLWEHRIKDVNGIYGDWGAFNPNQTAGVGFEGIVRAAGDIQYRATLTSERSHLSPVCNIDTHTAIALSPRVDPTVEAFNQVTSDILLGSQASSFQVYIGALLPLDSNMKLYVQYITDETEVDRTWVEVNSTTGIVNDGSRFREYVYQSPTETTFIGLKFKVALTGNRNDFPSLRDFRMISLA